MKTTLKNLTAACAAALIEAGEGANELHFFDDLGGVQALQADPEAALALQDMLDSVNQSRFVLVLNALSACGVAKVAQARASDTGSRSADGLALRYSMEHIGAGGNILSVTYSTENGYSIKDRLEVPAAVFAASLWHMLQAADARETAIAAEYAFHAASEKAQNLSNLANRLGAESY